MQTTTCRKCGARIAFIRMKSGKAMPVDTAPVRFHPCGGPETFVTYDGYVVRGKRGSDSTETGYISHFATCPAADSFRKRREPKHDPKMESGEKKV